MSKKTKIPHPTAPGEEIEVSPNELVDLERMGFLKPTKTDAKTGDVKNEGEK